MREERVEIDDVPARLFEPEGATGVLLFGHGGGHSKDGDRFVRLARLYAEGTGLAVVCIDAVDHGDRKPEAPSSGLPSGWHSGAMAQMVGDWQKTADAFEHIGPAVAYVGFSMGSIFGAATVAAMPSIGAAVFFVGGIPTGMGIDDPPLRSRLLDAAAELDHARVLMANMTQDDIFLTDDTHVFFDAIAGRRKQLTFWEGSHDEWPPESIKRSIAFINEGN